jgi:PAS domain S-box-containing protein
MQDRDPTDMSRKELIAALDSARSDRGSDPATSVPHRYLNQLHCGVVVQDADGQITCANDAACRILGLSREEILARSSRSPGWDMVDEQGQPQSGDEHPAMVSLRTCRPVVGAIRGVFSGDPERARWIRVSAEPICSEDGNPTEVVSTFVDITARRTAEQRLAWQREQSLEVLEQLPVGVVIHGPPPEAPIEYVNPRAAEMFGMVGEDATGTPISDYEGSVFGPDRKPVDKDELPALAPLETGQPVRDRIYGMLCQDGKMRWFAVSAFALPETDDGPRVMVTSVDISEHMEALQALEESETRYRLLAETTTDVIWQTTMDERFLYVNPAIEQLLGYTPEEFLHLPVTAVYPEEALTRLRGLSRRLIAQRDTRSRVMETEMIHKDGRTVPVEVSGRLVVDAEGQPVMFQGVARDLAARRQAEEQRRELEARVQHAQKLESLGVLAGGIAHDFNNLLMGILGNADLAMAELPHASPAIPSLVEIGSVARRAADLCNQMLAYSGKGRFVIEKLDLSEIVRDLSHMLRASISKQATLREELDDRLPPIEADPTQIRQVVMNLITNASEALDDRPGVISLTTGAFYHEGQPLSTGPVQQPLPIGMYVTLEVTDTGIGMDEETVSRIFDPFFTTKFTGRGLGLAAVQGIIRGHGGAILIDSAPGKGTTFRVLLPACEPARGTYAPEKTPDRTDWSASGMALLADDEETVRAVGRRMLERIGFEVLTARDGQEAVDLFRRHHRAIRAVLLDLTMPGLDGEAASRELAEIDPSVPVILCSGYTEQAIAERFADNPPAAFVQKPYRLEVLRETLQGILA